jgi:hypothetical protein
MRLCFQFMGIFNTKPYPTLNSVSNGNGRTDSHAHLLSLCVFSANLYKRSLTDQ